MPLRAVQNIPPPFFIVAAPRRQDAGAAPARVGLGSDLTPLLAPLRLCVTAWKSERLAWIEHDYGRCETAVGYGNHSIYYIHTPTTPLRVRVGLVEVVTP